MLALILALLLASVMAFGVEDFMETHRGILITSYFFEATQICLLGLLVVVYAYFYFVFHIHDEIQREQIQKWWTKGRLLFLVLIFLLGWAIFLVVQGNQMLYEDNVVSWYQANCLPLVADPYNRDVIRRSPFSGELHDPLAYWRGAAHNHEFYSLSLEEQIMKYDEFWKSGRCLGLHASPPSLMPVISYGYVYNHWLSFFYLSLFFFVTIHFSFFGVY
jgi:hypothetical protein